MNRTRRVVVSLVAVFVFVVVAVAAPSAIPTAAPGAAAEASDPAKEAHVVRVYYFHTTQRCASCKKIEALSEVAIRDGFGRELAAGTLEWQPVNTDEDPHRHFIQDYKLYTKSLVVVDIVNGRQVRWKNLPKIWEFLRDERVFQRYVQSEVRAYLETRS
jgi:hypothetical protein